MAAFLCRNRLIKPQCLDQYVTGGLRKSDPIIILLQTIHGFIPIFCIKFKNVRKPLTTRYIINGPKQVSLKRAPNHIAIVASNLKNKP